MSKRTKTKRRNKSGKGRTPRYNAQDHALIHAYTLTAANTSPLEQKTVNRLATGYYAALHELGAGDLGLSGFVRLSEVVLILAELTALLAEVGTERVREHYLAHHGEAQDAADHLHTLGERYNTQERFIATGAELSGLGKAVSSLHHAIQAAPAGLVMQAMRQSARTILPKAARLGVHYEHSGALIYPTPSTRKTHDDPHNQTK